MNRPQPADPNSEEANPEAPDPDEAIKADEALKLLGELAVKARIAPHPPRVPWRPIDRSPPPSSVPPATSQPQSSRRQRDRLWQLKDEALSPDPAIRRNARDALDTFYGFNMMANEIRRQRLSLGAATSLIALGPILVVVCVVFEFPGLATFLAVGSPIGTGAVLLGKRFMDNKPGGGDEAPVH